MITRSFSHYSDRTGSAPSLGEGRIVSLPYQSSISDHPKGNMATPLVSVFARFDAMIAPATAAQGLNTDRMTVAATDRGIIASVQRP